MPNTVPKRPATVAAASFPTRFLARTATVRISVSKGEVFTAYKEGENVNGEQTFYLHHLAWFANEKPMPVPVVEHLSHLCGDSRCFNVDHLWVESPVVNNSRKGCGRTVTCPCPCGHTFTVCDHKPQCISQ